jgi:hypothetical protein
MQICPLFCLFFLLSRNSPPTSKQSTTLIKYFKLYDPFRLIGLFLLLLLFRAAWLWQLHPLSLPDLYHMLIGEKLGEGFMLYAELKDNMPPLSALVYYLIDLGFGRSPLAYQILSLILLFFQAIIFNGLLADNRAFKELSNLSALAYILLGCSIFGFSTLSPALIALTFALGATQKLFYVIQHKAGRDALFSLGFLLSLSMLSDQHALILLLIFSLCIVFYSDVNTSQFFLFLIGFLFPLVLVGIYFFLVRWIGRKRNLLFYRSYKYRSYYQFKALFL